MRFIALTMLGLSRRALLRAVPALFTATVLAAAGAQPAFAQSSKIAPDLQKVLDASTTPVYNWTKDVSGKRLVKVLIEAESPAAVPWPSHPPTTALSVPVVRAGGAARHPKPLCSLAGSTPLDSRTSS